MITISQCPVKVFSPSFLQASDLRRPKHEVEGILHLLLLLDLLHLAEERLPGPDEKRVLGHVISIVQ